jgi:hypothetical protein
VVRSEWKRERERDRERKREIGGMKERGKEGSILAFKA